MKKSHIALLALLAVAAITTWLWFNNPLNALVKAAIENFGSEMTQTKVSVSKVDLSPTDGKGELSGLSLDNPKGFKTPHAFRADRIELALEPASLAEEVILIHRIHIDSPDISYEKNDSGTNFDAIQRNVESYLGASKKQTGKDAPKKMIIESLAIRNIKVNYNGMLDLKLPDIKLHNIGKKSGGATSAQVTRAIIAELNTKLAIALAKTAAIGAVGGVAIGVGMGIKSLLEK
ncbi:MAG: hypothetical protein A2061_02265 [Gallionellales bacterium GWA2_59_43]|nr:MAG: hypothetical protein A2061_02265 [Gallionellales bacterium GWA2_59_43]